MSQDRSLMDRLLKRAVPRAITACAPTPREISPALWVLDRELRHFGLARLPARTTIIRLRSGALVLVSPPPLLDGAAAAAIESIGAVTQIVAT